MKAEKADVSLLRRGESSPFLSAADGECRPPEAADTRAAAASATSAGTPGLDGEHGSAASTGRLAFVGLLPLAFAAAVPAGPDSLSAGLGTFVGVPAVCPDSCLLRLVGVVCVLAPC